ncbi:MAG TPA: hypothetical protein VF386_07895 [Usitatibacter sp.]
MSRFMIWSRVELRHGGFVAVATAIPCGTREPRAPEERALECDTRDGAEAAAARLAQSLSDDIHARGGRASAASRATEASPLY